MKETPKNRKITRNKMWPDTIVKMLYSPRYGKGANSVLKTTANVANLSSEGMFVLTDDLIPTDTDLELEIRFTETIGLNATGKVIRTEKNGIAVKFTQIDTTKLGECIMERLNIK